MHEPVTVRSFNVNDEPFLQRLKTATAPQHAALESQPLLQALMTPAVSKEQYRHYLLGMKAISEACEQTVWTLVGVSFAAGPSATALIEEDLRRLSSPGNATLSLPAFVFPKNLSLPFAWGFAYVMEGSKLGGRVIFKHLQKTLGIADDAGGAYLANKGADTGTEWKAFLQNLLAYTAVHRCEEEVVNGAIFGFRSIREYFEANGQPHDH